MEAPTRKPKMLVAKQCLASLRWSQGILSSWRAPDSVLAQGQGTVNWASFYLLFEDLQSQTPVSESLSMTATDACSWFCSSELLPMSSRSALLQQSLPFWWAFPLKYCLLLSSDSLLTNPTNFWRSTLSIRGLQVGERMWEGIQPIEKSRPFLFWYFWSSRVTRGTTSSQPLVLKLKTGMSMARRQMGLPTTSTLLKGGVPLRQSQVSRLSWFQGGLTIWSSVSLYTGSFSWLLRNSIYFYALKAEKQESTPSRAVNNEAPRITLPAIPEPPDDLTQADTFDRSANLFIFIYYQYLHQSVARSQAGAGPQLLPLDRVGNREEKELCFLQIFEFAMSMDDSGEEDCTVYIQELKSDNPSLKLNAASKISLIGAVLGHARVKDQLIPYLIQIIQQMDNDNDFLTKVAEGVLELKRNCSSPSELAALIYPLRVLASLDQPPVRDKAVSCLKQLADGQNRSFYQNHYYPLITALSKKDMAYAPKIAACCLIPSTYPQLPDSKQSQLRKIFKSLTLQEASPLLRRAVAQNVEDFAGVVDKKIIRGDFFDIWNSLINDTFDIIKIKALECAPVVARAFKKDEVSQKMFKQIKLVDSGKKSWRVRYSLVEALVAIAPYIEKDLVKKDVVEAFEELLKDQEAEVRAISVIKLPEITGRLGQQQAWNIFFEYISKASKDGTKESVPTVKLALVEAIVPYFKTVDKAQVMEQGIPILAALMKDENHVIRIGVMQRVMELGEVVGVQGTVQYLIPLIEGCLTDKKWRFKLAIAQNIPSFFKTLPYEGHKEFLDKILSTFFRDHNYAVRQQTMKSLIECSKLVEKQTFWQLIQKHVNNLAGDGNYIYRVTATLFLKEIEGLDKTQLGQLVSEIIKKFQNEKVSNVLVSLFISYSQVKANLPAQVRKEFQAYLSKIKEEKQDEDVLYYATRAQD